MMQRFKLCQSLGWDYFAKYKVLLVTDFYYLLQGLYGLYATIWQRLCRKWKILLSLIVVLTTWCINWLSLKRFYFLAVTEPGCSYKMCFHIKSLLKIILTIIIIFLIKFSPWVRTDSWIGVGNDRLKKSK